MLSLEITFLTGRYVATAYDDRSRAEWPPHPARIFSALSAAHFESESPSPEEREVLLWLETLGAPELFASAASERETVTVFVPVNDVSVVGTLDDAAAKVEDAARALEEARAAGGTKLSKAEKRLETARLDFLERVKKTVEALPAGKERAETVRQAAAVLPERRIRQPRTFPSVSPESAAVTLTWPNASASAAQLATLDSLAARVVRIGHSSSLVSIRVSQERKAPTWVPLTGAEHRAEAEERTLRLFAPGQLQALEETFETQGASPGRVMPATFQRYGRPLAQRNRPPPAPVLGRDWLVLRRVQGPRLSSTMGVELARTTRKALLAAFGPDAPEILSGHGAPGVRSDRAHLAVVPLPFVGHERADGAILGVALMIPRAATPDARRDVYRAVSTWQAQQRTDEDAAPLLPVHLGKAGIVSLELLDEPASQINLLPETWCSRSATWASATPVALDRNPGDLRSADPRKEAEAYAAAEESIAAACEYIGLPRPERVVALQAAPLAGADKARQFPPYRTGTPPLQRVLVHARLTFAQPVEGPIVLGAGRYFGLGLFRPTRDHD